ncbi:hypothetical protein H4S06_001396, partial [Coemansia sp. BCRC 34490]
MTQEQTAHTAPRTYNDTQHAAPTPSGLFTLQMEAVGDCTEEDDGDISDDSASDHHHHSDDSSDGGGSIASDGESYMGKWYGNYEAKENIRSQSIGSSHDSVNSSSNSSKRQLHHWRSRPPLLPERIAAIVSSLSGATRLSLEITSLFWEAVFETIAESTSSSLMLGSVAWSEAKAITLAIAGILSPLSALNPQVVSRIISSSTAAGYAVMNQSLTAAENILEGGFSLYTKAINMSLHAAGEYVRLIDAVFGSTDTSRVLASFVHMCRREALDKNPEIRALIGEVGLVSFVSQVLKTIAAWICLQVVNHGRSRPYRLDLVYTNIRRGPEFCSRKFIDSNGKPLLSRKSSFARTPEPPSPRMCGASAENGTFVDSCANAPSPHNTHSRRAQPNAEAADSGNVELNGSMPDLGSMRGHVNAQTTLPSLDAASAGHVRSSFPNIPEPLNGTDSRYGSGTLSEDDEYDDAYHALSDQDTPHRDPEWDQRLVEALRGLSLHLERQKQHQHQTKDSTKGKYTDLGLDTHSQPTTSSSLEDTVPSPQQQQQQQQQQGHSLWETITAVRAASAREKQQQQMCPESTDTSSACGSPPSPLLSASIQRSMGLPTFESAPASLISSPQFPATPSVSLNENIVHSAHTLPKDAAGLSMSGLDHPGAENGTSWKEPVPEVPDDLEETYKSFPRLSDIRLADPPSFIDPPPHTSRESVWLQQEFPRKPLLFNLARFISLASSVYGKSFMQVLGLDHGMIDARALIDEFGDFEVHEQEQSIAPASHLSRTSSNASMNNNDAGASTNGLPSSLRAGERTPTSTSRHFLPRAQPMSTYHKHAGYVPSRPDSQRQYERRHFRTTSRTTDNSTSASGRRSTTAGVGRRPPVRRNHHRQRPVTDHPNHYCFSQHSGIPLSDLLFSSYVSPIVPGVTRSANVKATAVERKLRRKSSHAALKSQSGSQMNMQGVSSSRNSNVGVESKPTDQQGNRVETAVATPAASETGGWISGIPIVGSIYQRLPSPMGALASIPVIPGLVSRIVGGKGKGEEEPSAKALPSGDRRAAKASTGEPKRRADDTKRQFRRFEKIRQRLVYRNPSIHALVHYIAVDHATRSVVLACRGTLGISDLFIDMICEYETIRIPSHEDAARECDEFRVHSGMWHSALLLADSSSEVFREVAEALRLYPEYGLVLTGHSLGGGVASLVTLLWSQPAFDTTTTVTGGNGSAPSASGGHPPTPGSTRGSTRRFVTMDKFGLVTPRPIHCFSFGSPCSTNASLSYYCRGLVTSVANSDDFITYLSIGACVDILNISAVLGREHGVAEKVVRKFFSAQKHRLGKKLNLFDFDFSRLRAYKNDDDDDGEADDDGERDDGSGGASRDKRKRNGSRLPREERPASSFLRHPWSQSAVHKDHIQGGSNSRLSKKPRHDRNSHPKSTKATQRQGGGEEESKKAAKDDLDDWYLSLIKTLRASMDSEKLYPPGDVFVLATLGDDEIADRELATR